MSNSQEFCWDIAMFCFAASVLNPDMVLFSKCAEPTLLIKPRSRIMIMSSGQGSPLLIPRQVHNQQRVKTTRKENTPDVTIQVDNLAMMDENSYEEIHSSSRQNFGIFGFTLNNETLKFSM